MHLHQRYVLFLCRQLGGLKQVEVPETGLLLLEFAAWKPVNAPG